MFNIFKKRSINDNIAETIIWFERCKKHFILADEDIKNGLPDIVVKKALVCAHTCFNNAVLEMKFVSSKSVDKVNHPEYQNHLDEIISFMTLDAHKIFVTTEIKDEWDKMIRSFTSTNTYNELVG